MNEKRFREFANYCRALTFGYFCRNSKYSYMKPHQELWYRVGFDSEYFSIICTGLSFGGAIRYANLRILAHPRGWGRMKCFCTIRFDLWDAYIQMIKNGKQKQSLTIPLQKERGFIKIQVIEKEIVKAKFSILPTKNTSGAHGIVEGSVKIEDPKASR